jgi:cell division protease FtsH
MKLFFTLLFLPNIVNSFINKPSYLKKTTINLIQNNFNELDFIKKYNMFFDKENYNMILNDLLDHKLQKIIINNDYSSIISLDNIKDNNDLYSHYHIAKINPNILSNLIQLTNDMKMPIYFTDFSNDMINIQKISNYIVSLIGGLLPFVLLYYILIIGRNYFMMNMMMNNNNNPFNLMSKKENTIQKINTNVTLDDWAGSPEVIEECKEVISYIENKEKFNKIGAEMPKGILFEGPPGTGKTLLAKAIAGETNSTFISMSGSEFVELYVGMGASRVRELFSNARENSPCIIFIDEIDAVGKQRGSGINMGNDEREQTLNQLLYEMDGFESNDDIVIIAATNRKDILDQALLRPGRFDRIIRIPVPDKDSRIKILDHYLKSKNIENSFDISSIAELTDGFSGAQLKNLINEAAILSARNNYEKIQEKYIFDAFEKLIVGLIRTNATVAPNTKFRVAIHESGHSLLAMKFNDYFEFKKASIQPTYNGAGGYTIFTEKPEIKDGLYTKDMLKKRLIIGMGGKAAESIYYGNDYVSLGAIQDLKQVNSLAQRMIGNFGMGDKLEVFYNENIDSENNPFFGSNNKYSEHTKLIIDKETLNLVNEAYIQAKKILSENEDLLMRFTNLLINNTTIYKNDLISTQWTTVCTSSPPSSNTT